jgi:hypothetical protein
MTMRLFNIHTHIIEGFCDSETPPYAVLSSTCPDEISTAAQAQSDSIFHQQLHPVPDWVIRACDKVNEKGLSYLWVRALCVDWSSTFEVQHAVNGSFKWLQDADVCLVHLDDLPSEGPRFDLEIWTRCRYWTRSWTLPELTAPSRVEFFDATWQHRGSKSTPELNDVISNITGISRSVLYDPDKLWDTSTAARMSWASQRTAARAEDTAYALAGIFDVSMSARYGEGAERAFRRLQEKILKNTRDGSIFAWESRDGQEYRGLLAKSPSEFGHFLPVCRRGWQDIQPWAFDGEVSFNSKGVKIRSRFAQSGPRLNMEIGQRRQISNRHETVGICLDRWNGVYVRADPSSTVCFPAAGGSPGEIHIVRHIDARTSVTITNQGTAGGRVTADGTSSRRQAIDDLFAPSTITIHNTNPGASTKLPPVDQFEPHHYQVGSCNLPVRQVTPCQLDHAPPLKIHLPRPKLVPYSGLYSISQSTPQAVNALIGLKRDRYGHARKPSDCNSTQCTQVYVFHGAPKNSDHERTSIESDDGDDDSCSNSYTDWNETDYSGDEGTLSDDLFGEELALPEDHELQTIRADLVQSSLRKFRLWMAGIRYEKPPADQPPPPKRKRIHRQNLEASNLVQGNDSDDPDLIVIKRLAGYFHCACPFYRFDPVHYHDCAEKHDLQSVEDVKKHVWDRHRCPLYCPTCRRTFDMSTERDDHIRERLCKVDESIKLHGITEDERCRLSRRDNPMLSEESRLNRVFRIVLPGQQPVESPYLDSGVGLDISMLRDFWAREGPNHVSSYLEAGNVLSWTRLDEKRALAALHSLVLQDMIDDLVRGHVAAPEEKVVQIPDCTRSPS